MSIIIIYLHFDKRRNKMEEKLINIDIKVQLN
jgi:hypothetical protein